MRPVNESPRDAATYVWSLSSSKTYMVLNVRDHDSIDHTLIHDTLSAVYSMLDGTKYGNLSINIVDFDYTGTPLGTLQAQTDDFTDTVTVQPECYVQMMGGLDTRLALDDVAQQLYKLRIIDGDTLSIMINQATMYIRIADQTVDGLNAAPTRLGSYLNIRNMTPHSGLHVRLREEHASIRRIIRAAIQRIPQQKQLLLSAQHHILYTASYGERDTARGQRQPPVGRILPLLFGIRLLRIRRCGAERIRKRSADRYRSDIYVDKQQVGIS
ncbi:MAG: hypothetical protein L6V35_07925 [Alistipes putredinis]|nr:MAG: hypothetical protein L6V35_07925 [Alistipes putredinis]